MSEIKTTQVKAFLSHATSDKPFVDIVATRLGKRRVMYDKWAFEGGVPLTSAISSSLASSDVFILFASRKSIASHWVRFEIDEAQQFLISEKLKGALTIIIDSETRPSDLPGWMQKSLIEHTTSPRAAARNIEYHLNKMRGIESDPLYLGREALSASFSEALIPPQGATPPRTLILGGLPGIGRKTFLGHISRDLLSMRVGPIFTLRNTDGMDRLHLLLLDELGALDSKEQLALAVQQFQQSSPEERAKTLALLLAGAGQGNILPVIVDDGAFLDSRARYTTEAQLLLSELKNLPQAMIGLIHSKRPQISSAEFAEVDAAYIRVPPLELAPTKLLLTQSLRRSSIPATADQVAELSPYLDGYPPAVHIAVASAREYGLTSLLADKSGLVDYKIRTFAAILEKLKLSAQEQNILRLLTEEVSFPLAGIATTLDIPQEEIVASLRRLIDLNLVLPAGESFGIALPVRSAVYSLYGGMTRNDFALMAEHLKKEYWDGNDSLPSVEIIQATIGALLHAQNAELSEFSKYVLPSTLYKVAKDFYQNGGIESWKSALELLDNVLSLYPKHRQALVLRFKTLIRLGEWSKAEMTLGDISAAGLAEHSFLTGFMFWKKREYGKAISAFRAAISSGQSAPEIYHGLATCLLRLQRYSEAASVVKESLSKGRPNIFIVDLGAKIALVREDFEEAADYIKQLERLRAVGDYNHRMATLLGAKRQYTKALPYAEAARGSTQHRFEVEATYINILIEVRDYDKAKNLLNDLQLWQKLASDKHDVMCGLSCKLFLRQGMWQQAEGMWSTLEDKKSSVHLGLRAEILDQKLADPATSPGSRAEAAAERASIHLNGQQENLLLFSSAELSDDPSDVGE